MPDKTYDILIDIRARLGALDQISRHVANARREAEGFNNAFKLGSAIGITSQLAAQLGQIPARLVDAVADGIRFNATLEDARRGVAAVSSAFQPGRFASFDDALKDSVVTVDLLKEKAKETSATFQELLEGYQANAGPIFQVGINKAQEQVNLLVAASQAMSALAIPTYQLNQELRGVLAGDTSRISRLNQVLGVTKEEMEEATTSGRAYQFLMARLAPFIEAAKRGQDSFNVAVSNTKDSLTQLSGIATELLFKRITTAVLDFNKELAKPQAAEFARGLGGELDALAHKVESFVENTKKEFEVVKQIFTLGGYNKPLLAVGNALFEGGPSPFQKQAAEEFTQATQRASAALIQQIAHARTLEERARVQIAQEVHRIGLVERLADKNKLIADYAGGHIQALRELLPLYVGMEIAATATAKAMKLTGEQLDAIITKTQALQSFRAETQVISARAFGDDRGAFELNLEQERIRLQREQLKLNGEDHIAAAREVDARIRALREEFEANQQIKESKKDKLALDRESRDLKREERDLIREISDAQNAVTSNPFLTIGEKNSQLIPLLLQEAEAHRAAGNAAQAHAAQMQALSLSFGGGLQAGLISWVNSFGTAAQQVSNIITGTLNTAISATSQLITDAIFRTGDWRKAFAQAAQAIVQNLIQIGIQMLVNAALSSFIKKKDTGEGIAAGSALTGAYAPAAAASSVATSGGSAYLGAIAAAVAIAAILALLLGGFESGGYTGGGGRKQIAGVVHGQEFVQPKGAVDFYGLSIMEAIRQRRIPPAKLQALLGNYRVSVAPRFGAFEAGGAVAAISGSVDQREAGSGSSGEQKIELFHFMDPDAMARKIMKSDAGTIGVIDAVNGKFHLIRRNA